MKSMMTDPDKVEGASGKQVLTVPQLSFNHKGGMLASAMMAASTWVWVTAGTRMTRRTRGRVPRTCCR
jgi:hypothetical protein